MAAPRPSPPVLPPPQVLPVLRANAPKIDYKDTRLLSRYISERGKIVPSRITAVSAEEAARTRPGDQARALSRPAALRDPLTHGFRPQPATPPDDEDIARRASWASASGRPPLTANSRGTAKAMLQPFRRRA